MLPFSYLYAVLKAAFAMLASFFPSGLPSAFVCPRFFPNRKKFPIIRLAKRRIVYRENSGCASLNLCGKIERTHLPFPSYDE
jgi:hypothetical protein